MSASFRLSLDTVTHVTAAINGGKEETENVTVTLELELDSDCEKIKVWGDIDTDSETNTRFGADEELAPWIDPEEALLVQLAAGQGQRHLFVRVRDDVWNEATATAAIAVGEGEVIIPPTPEPTLPPPGGGEPRRRQPVRRAVADESTFSVSSESLVRSVQADAVEVNVETEDGSRARGASPSTVRFASTSGISAVAVSLGEVRAYSQGTVRKRPGDDLIAALLP